MDIILLLTLCASLSPKKTGCHGDLLGLAATSSVPLWGGQSVTVAHGCFEDSRWHWPVHWWSKACLALMGGQYEVTHVKQCLLVTNFTYRHWGNLSDKTTCPSNSFFLLHSKSTFSPGLWDWRWVHLFPLQTAVSGESLWEEKRLEVKWNEMHNYNYALQAFAVLSLWDNIRWYSASPSIVVGMVLHNHWLIQSSRVQ